MLLRMAASFSTARLKPISFPSSSMSTIEEPTTPISGCARRKESWADILPGSETSSQSMSMRYSPLALRTHRARVAFSSNTLCSSVLVL